jgi:FixJ family two-component response regulator
MTGCLVTYGGAEDFVLNSTAGRVALVILAGEEDPAATQRTLRWLRRRWPGCPIIVVRGAGGVEHEMAARRGGALYLSSGEAAKQLPEMVSHTLRARVKDRAGLSA